MKIHNITQGSDEWFELRAGMPTASNASKLVSGTGKISTSMGDYALLLAAEKYAGKPLDEFEGNGFTERGKILEAEALVAYDMAKGTFIEPVGFCTSDSGAYGCSPDGLLEEGMVEAKCLIAKNHVKMMLYYNKHKKVSPEYISQVQMQMLVTGRQWCDIVFYHPELPLLIIRVDADFVIQALLVKQIVECLKVRDKALEVIECLDEPEPVPEDDGVTEDDYISQNPIERVTE